jgi:hypothetical protein
MERPGNPLTHFARPAPFVLLAAAAAALATSGCSRKVSGSDCAALLDHFVALQVAEDPKTKDLTGSALDSAKIAKVQAMQSDPDVQQVEKACVVEVSRAEYDCASKATTSKAWNACIQ